MASELFIKAGQAEQDLKWAKIWFRKLAEFTFRQQQATDQDSQSDPDLQRFAMQLRDWEFTANDVIAFLRSKRDAGIPAWKRMKIIRGLMVYRRIVVQKPDDDLVPLRKRWRRSFDWSGHGMKVMTRLRNP